jgi:ribonuclease T2
MKAVLLLLLALALPAHAEGEWAGDFDYYVMALTWSPNWCALEGDARDDDQCDARHAYGFTLHGLWPQYESGYPSGCRSAERDPSRAETGSMTDIMGSGGLAWYQWKKHGRCTGLTARDYFATARRAYGSVTLPDVFQRLNRSITLPAAVVEDAFVEANPALPRDAITITCEAGMIQEVRLCLTKDLSPRRCGDDVIRDCRMKDAVMAPVR